MLPTRTGSRAGAPRFSPAHPLYPHHASTRSRSASEAESTWDFDRKLLISGSGFRSRHRSSATMQGTPDLFRIPGSLINKIVVRINVLSPQSFTRPGQNHERKCLGESARPCKRSWLSVTRGRAGAGRVVQRLSEGSRALQGLSQVLEEGAVNKGGFTPPGWKPGLREASCC